MTNSLDKWPLYYKDQLIIGDPTMDTAVVTLWTPKELVAKALDLSRVSLVGQLYTRRGINFVLRNILANPRLKKLFVLGNDLSGSGEALLNYDFEIDKEIDPKAFNDFKQNVSLIDNRKIPAKTRILGQNSSPWRKPQIFADPKPNSLESYPSEFSSLVIREDTVAAAWVQILKNLLKFAVKSKPVMYYDEGGSQFIKELLNMVVVVEKENPYKIEVPHFLPFNRADVERYLKNFFKKDRGEDDYTYGERLFDYDGFNQIERMIKKLKQFSQDKGALAVLWKPKEDSFPRYKSLQPKRVPCLTLVQGQVWEGKLYLTAYFRSNDMGSAWPLNAFALRSLQSKVAKELKAELGSLTTISNMAQLYERDYVLAAKIVKNQGQKANCHFDPRGNLVIAVENGVIKVVQIAPDGAKVLNHWTQKGSVPNASQILGDKILGDLALSQVSHALDIGRQLARAEEAARRGLAFTQDRPLTL